MGNIITMPDMGDIASAEIIEVLVKVGDTIDVDASICMVESDKASMEIPSTQAGKITAVHIAVGDKLAAGDKLIVVESSSEAQTDTANAPAATSTKTATASAPSSAASNDTTDFDVVVLGSGPGGYAAAFRAADLGLSVAMIERHSSLGGVCLNVGCIPSKALLHVAKLIKECEQVADHGVRFGKAEIDIDALRAHKDDAVSALTAGVAQMAKMRKVTVLNGVGEFLSTNEIRVSGTDSQTVRFKNAIIAAGSRVVKLPFFPWEDKRVMDSTDALELADIPQKLLIVGGGVIGMEMGSVYAALGSSVDIVELSPALMAGADADLLRPYARFNNKTFNKVYLNTSVTNAKAESDGITVTFEGENAPEQSTYDKVLVAVGRRPNSDQIGAQNLQLDLDERGFIPVDKQMRTKVENIFAIGDIVGQPMLAHKATHEAHVAAEVIAGHKTEFIANVIPSVAYTDPEVAWVGLTEIEAKAQGIAYEKASFPWAASGRATAMSRKEGVTKLLFDPESDRVLGGGIVGVGAGDLIGEVALAVEMQADAHDIGLTIHPHPTMTESIGMAAETYLGSVTDIIAPKRKK